MHHLKHISFDRNKLSISLSNINKMSSLLYTLFKKMLMVILLLLNSTAFYREKFLLLINIIETSASNTL